MPSLKEIRRRIGGTKDIQKITRAMQTVAGVRLRRAQDQLFAARPYSDKMKQLLQHLSAQADKNAHPLLAEREVRASVLVVVTADRGFCGSFNSNVIRRALETHSATDLPPSLICIGRKGAETLKRSKVNIIEGYLNVFQALEYSDAMDIADQLIGMYTAGEIDRVDVLYNEFKSAGQQNLVLEQLLPVVPETPKEDPFFTGYIYEPSQAVLLNDLLPQHFRFQIWRTLLESNTAEEAARMLAMDNATRNAGDLIDELTLSANKLRQSTITSELMDIVGGAEAIK
ncbi:MAG: ATP synthase F1 subunit gamma [Candidatus Latescibacteria bacterium]|nr:ATP synthase F1 subunit gamma [Candidatus Latescibacterota bacterium]